jgi:hypothetical protein
VAYVLLTCLKSRDFIVDGMKPSVVKYPSQAIVLEILIDECHRIRTDMERGIFKDPRGTSLDRFQPIGNQITNITEK